MTFYLMNDITDLITENKWRHIFVSLIFIILFILLTLASNFIFKKLRNRALRSKSLIVIYLRFFKFIRLAYFFHSAQYFQFVSR